MRISFLNDKHDKGIYIGQGTFSGMILDYYKSIMNMGIMIGDFNFKFLHYSNSQMKSHSCWFFSENNGLTYDSVIKSLGDFKDKKISKNAARRGQCFTSAITVKTLDINTEIKEIKDIERNGFTFSDGCGEICADLAKEISRTHFKTEMCSAFQIRMGGYKGVLVVADKFKDSVKIHTRKSMSKFDLDPKKMNVDLEIIRCSSYSPGYLNKQIISILWANGVNEEYLLKIQKDFISEITDLYKMSNIKSKKKSSRKLSNITEIPQILLHSLKSNIQEQLIEMHNEGTNYYKDPLIGPFSKLCCYKKLQSIRNKFRIFDPNCCVLLGVIDPYQCLEESEIYVSINSRAYRQDINEFRLKTLEGNVLVTRNPCVHPGDIRVLKAVVKEELKYLTNVIVFSSKGERPDQDKMGTGDLDGDIYWINWNKTFVEQFEEYPPEEKDVNPEGIIHCN